MNNFNPKTQAAVNAMGILGAKFIKRSPAHVYFDIPKEWDISVCTKLAKEFIRQTGIGVKMRRK